MIFSTKSLSVMVSQKLLNMNNSINLSSITSILISLSSHNLMKDSHLSKPVGEKGKNPTRPSSSQDYNTGREVQYFLGHLLQFQVIPFESFRESPRTWNKEMRQSVNDRETAEKIDIDPQYQVAR